MLEFPSRISLCVNIRDLFELEGTLHRYGVINTAAQK